MVAGDKLTILSGGHIPSGNDGEVFVPLDMWTERKLKKELLPYISVAEFVPNGSVLRELSEQVDVVAREWYRLPEASGFFYKNIRLGEIYEPMLGFYLGRLLYYIHTIDGLVASQKNVSSITVLGTPTSVSDTAGVFSQFENTVISDAAWSVCKKYNIPFTGIASVTKKQQLFPQDIRRFLLSLFNACMSMFPSKPIKLFVSDYWSHLSPFVTDMDDVELVCMDRSEIRKIPFSQILKHRIRFMHPLDKITSIDKLQAEEYVKNMTARWDVTMKSLSSHSWFTHQDVDWFPLFNEALSYAMTHYSIRVIADYESIARIYRKQQIDKVLLRASIGGRQHHFLLAARVAQELGIPSIELQHANEVVDKTSVHSRMEADYLASYGKATQTSMASNHGYEVDRIRLIGSPRFDAYRLIQAPNKDQKKILLAQMGLSTEKPVVFVGMPAEFADVYFIHFDSYAIATLLRELRDVQLQNAGVQFILKFRPGNVTDEYRELIQELFPRGIFIAEYEDPYELIQTSDIVLAGNSTIFFEAMQAGVPTVFFPLRDNDICTRDVYQNVAPAPKTKDALSALIEDLLLDPVREQHLVQSQTTYLSESYSFDGRASERMTALIREFLVGTRANGNPLSSRGV